MKALTDFPSLSRALVLHKGAIVMASISSHALFTVWGADLTAYGPVDLPALVSWVKDERVTADTWVFAATNGAWHRAADVPELQLFFQAKAGTAAADST